MLRSNSTRLSFAAGAAALLWLLLMCGAQATQTWQSIDEIRQIASAELRTSAPDDERRTVTAAALDPRLRLARCDQPLEAFLPHGRRGGANITVGVRCAGTQPWKVFVPVRIETLGKVLVAAQPLARNAIISAGDLVLVERSLESLHHGYLDDPAALVGKRLLRPAARGAVLNPSMVGTSRLIRRGQRVTLTAAASGVNIRMLGKALADGAQGQRIRVQNLSSRRIVEGLVRSAEVVEVLLE